MIANGTLKQHHHVHISQKNHDDLLVWRQFLSHPSVFCRPFMDLIELNAEDIDMYSDASGSYTNGGFGAYCGSSWCFGKWNTTFMQLARPSIEYLELYGLTVGVLLWIKRYKN